MNKAYIILLAICALIFIGVASTLNNQQIDTTKAIVIRQPPYTLRNRRYGYVPPPPHYNPYKAQYY